MKSDNRGYYFNVPELIVEKIKVGDIALLLVICPNGRPSNKYKNITQEIELLHNRFLNSECFL